MPTYPEFDAIIKDCDKNCIVKFLKTIFPGETRKGKVVGKFGGAEQKTRIDGLNILGSVTLETSDGRSKPIICCAKQMDGVLSERSSRRKQFDDSVTVLKEVFVKPYVGNGSVEGAFTQGLFFFFDDKGNFRLSLVTSEIVNGKQELNNYRRQSFFVEAGARNNTFRTRICKKIAAYEDLKSAFDVEKLSDDFFREYKVFYEDIVQYVTGARYIEVKKNKYERTEMSAPNSEIFNQFIDAYKGKDEAEKAVRNYVKKLMGRLVFIQFLQKKGWLGIPMRTVGWKDGDKDFLQHLFDHVSPEEQNSFVDKVLEEVLFYSFNRKESERKLKNSTLKKFKFPFLNCGLFDKDQDDDFDFALPGAVFHNKKFYDTERKAPDIKSWIKKRKPYFNDEVCGLFDFFDRFNFTIDENDPTDADVSVDPEMLGKIFENLLEDNKDKGAFYTPKEIVGYMCNESLIAYLESECPSLRHPERSSACHPERSEGSSIRSSSRHSERSEESSIRSLVVDLNADSFTEKEKEILDQKLSEVKICDPAIGSGAFPMGLLNLLYKIRLKLGVVQKKSKNPEATLKREIIQQNIYGVDIEKGAVDIAQLRFWLSLVVDEVEPDALPNLEYKIMQGNSLLESYEGIDLSSLAGEGKNRSRGKASDQLSLVFDEKQAMEQIQKDLNSFYKTDDYNVKEHLKKDINLNVKNYIKHIAPEKSKAIDVLPLPNDKFFLWHTYFRDVFDRKEKCGFDIVIGNPPYIQLQTMGEICDVYEKAGFDAFNRTGDIYCLFVENGLNLLKTNGVLTYIMPNKWMQAGYGKELRSYLSKKKILSFVDFGDFQIFANATTYVCIPLIQNAKASTTFKASYMRDADMSKIPARENVFNSADFGEESWVLSSSGEKKLRDHLQDVFPNLKTFVGGEAYRGVVSGLTKAFVIDDSTYRNISCGEDNSKTIMHPMIRGRDVQPYQYAERGGYLIGTFPALKLKIEDYPGIKKWLLTFGEKKLEQTGKKYIINGEEVKARKKTANKWFETQDQIGYYSQFAKPKIMYQAFQVKPCFIYDQEGLYCNNSMWILPTENKALLGLLNSKMGWWLISKYCTQIQNGYQLIWKYFGEIPIALKDGDLSNKISSLVDSILATKKKDPSADTSKQEAEIDKLVYELYGLTDEEIAIVEGTSATTSAAKPEKTSTSSQTTSVSADWLQGEDL